MTPTYLDDIVDFHRDRASRDTRDWRERLDTCASRSFVSCGAAGP